MTVGAFQRTGELFQDILKELSSSEIKEAIREKSGGRNSENEPDFSARV